MQPTMIHTIQQSPLHFLWFYLFFCSIVCFCLLSAMRGLTKDKELLQYIICEEEQDEKKGNLNKCNSVNSSLQCESDSLLKI